MSRGAFYILKPGAAGCEVLTHLSLEGRCFGSPTVYNGKVYVQTTRKLYAFGRKGKSPGLAAEPKPEAWPKAGIATQSTSHTTASQNQTPSTRRGPITGAPAGR